MARKAEDPELVPLHVRVPRDVLEKLFAKLVLMRKKDPMATLSDVTRETLKGALR